MRGFTIKRDSVVRFQTPTVLTSQQINSVDLRHCLLFLKIVQDFQKCKLTKIAKIPEKYFHKKNLCDVKLPLGF